MSDSYKHSYIVGENLLNSLSVYNVGYQKCDPEYQWGPGVRDHYCIHHIFSGSGSYMIGEKQIRLKEGDTFILYPGVEVRYCADREKPWEYGWAGFMGTDAASIIRNTDFTKKIPYIPAGKIPDRKIREGLQKIYDVKGNTYEAAVAMTGALYSFLAVFMHYHESEVPERDARMMYVESRKLYRNELFLSCDGGRCCGLCRNQQKSSVPLFSDLYELFAKGIFVPVQDQAGMQAFKGD